MRTRSARKKIAVLVPCYNEEEGIRDVINGFLELAAGSIYKIKVIVIDKNSKDNTAAVARSLGATVIYEPRQGKAREMPSELVSTMFRMTAIMF
jgi:glycosyltransferase involved in cell wall biosynthesis